MTILLKSTVEEIVADNLNEKPEVWLTETGAQDHVNPVIESAEFALKVTVLLYTNYHT